MQIKYEEINKPVPKLARDSNAKDHHEKSDIQSVEYSVRF